MTTKEKILHTSLKLFAQEGYEAVSVSRIASELGITKGALYKHYRNKRHIFDSILERMEQQDSKQAASHGLTPDLPQGAAQALPEENSLEKLIEFSHSMFEYWTEDEFASNFRKMLTLEQYRSPEMNRLYQQYLASGPLEYVKDILTSGGMDPQTAKHTAAAFYGPMFLFYSCYDGAQNDEQKHKVKDSFGEHLEKMRSIIC